jgi:L-iditol 2-dehydrogenase
MLACLLKGPGKVALEDILVPKTGRGDVLIRMRAGGICGTDIEKIHGGYGPGGILGHEASGVIEQAGEGVKDLTRGDRVVAHHHVPCYNCQYCQRGDHTMCDFFKSTNFDPCGFAELFRVPEFNVSRGAVIPLPDSVGFEEAALLEPTACCIRALDKLRVQAGDKALVVGLGPTGLTHLQLLRNMGAGLLLGSDVQKARLDMAKKLGADQVFDAAQQNVVDEVKQATITGVDIAIVSTGNPKALSQAVSSVRKGGKVMLFGAPAQGAFLQLDVSSLFSRQVSILTSYSCVEGEISRALHMLQRRAIDLASMITYRFPLKDAKAALEFAGSSSSAVKTMITS